MADKPILTVEHLGYLYLYYGGREARRALIRWVALGAIITPFVLIQGNRMS